MFREGLLIVVSGPSGTGKGTLLKLLGETTDNIRYSVSATTRRPREGETDGENYFFKTIDVFKSMIANDELIEWVEYCDNFYGTPRKHIEDSVKQGYNIILEIEVNGALNIKNKYPNCVSIFILPPSFDELKKRITGRGTEDIDVIEKRLAKAKKEMTYADKYDYIIVNDNLTDAVKDLNSVLNAERLQTERNKDIINRICFSE